MSLEQSLLDLTNEGLGYLFVLMPGQNTWEKFYCVFKNCLLYLMTSVKG